MKHGIFSISTEPDFFNKRTTSWRPWPHPPGACFSTLPWPTLCSGTVKSCIWSLDFSQADAPEIWKKTWRFIGNYLDRCFKTSSFTVVICQFFGGGGRLNMTGWNTLFGTLRWIWQSVLDFLRMVPVGSPWTGKQTRQLTSVVNKDVPLAPRFFRWELKVCRCDVSYVFSDGFMICFAKSAWVFLVQTVESLEKNMLPSCRGWLQVT